MVAVNFGGVVDNDLPARLDWKSRRRHCMIHVVCETAKRPRETMLALVKSTGNLFTPFIVQTYLYGSLQLLQYGNRFLDGPSASKTEMTVGVGFQPVAEVSCGCCDTIRSLFRS